MRALAAFVSSEAGQLYARTQTYYGRDVAEFIEPFDDVLAHNVRVGFMVAMNRAEEPDEGTKHLAAAERAHEASKRMREANPWLPG